jgi:thiamine-phosphate pyrophosphorylase
MMTHAERMARFARIGLYVVITERFCGGRAAVSVLNEVLAAGVRVVQFREKELDDRTLFERASAFRERTQRAGALLIIDDRIDVALAAGADGVHLGQTDLPIDAARRIAPDLIIGASTYSLDEALAAQSAGASYVNIGPIFPTQTKAVSTGPVGPAMIDAIVPHLTIPWTCMGGIKLHNIHEVLQRGARHVAVVTAVTEAPDVRAAVAGLRMDTWENLV